MKKQQCFSILYLCWFACVHLSIGKADEITQYVIKIGTLEPAARPQYGYYFVSGDEKQFFDTGPNAVSARALTGIYDLSRAGFRLDNGKEYLQHGEREGELNARAVRENPGAKVFAIIFHGEGGSIVEIKVEGKTPVCRIDLRIGDKDVTLWANREKVDEAPKEPGGSTPTKLPVPPAPPAPVK